tara:strand:- start:2506 stop:2697 length:192 start_codon:yes stop_codon:yes gene_type:complete
MNPHPMRLWVDRNPVRRTRVNKKTDPAIHGIEMNPNFSMYVTEHGVTRLHESASEREEIRCKR